MQNYPTCGVVSRYSVENNGIQYYRHTAPCMYCVTKTQHVGVCPFNSFQRKIVHFVLHKNSFYLNISFVRVVKNSQHYMLSPFNRISRPCFFLFPHFIMNYIFVYFKLLLMHILLWAQIFLFASLNENF